MSRLEDHMCRCILSLRSSCPRTGLVRSSYGPSWGKSCGSGYSVMVVTLTCVRVCTLIGSLALSAVLFSCYFVKKENKKI